jgi:hypothetical protein
METMRRATVAAAVREQVQAVTPGTFLRSRDFVGSPRAVDTELSRLRARGELRQVRRGLYWRGVPTRFGMTAPSPLDIALAVAGPGAGPAGVAAARQLGLTTQVPATVEVAAPGKVPEPVPGVRFTARPFARRERKLSPTEVAVLEVLRETLLAEASLEEVGRRIQRLADNGQVRPQLIASSLAVEHNLQARRHWAGMAWRL